MITTSDLVRVSLRQVLRQRAVGVVFAIAIGITAFITLSVLGREIRYSIGQDMVLMGGVNVVQVLLDHYVHPDLPVRPLHPAAIAEVRALPGVDMVSLNVMGDPVLKMCRGQTDYCRYTPTQGIDENFAAVFAGEALYGRLFTAEDVDEHRRVCLLGREAAREFFGRESDAVGGVLFVGTDIFEVVGVMGGVMLGSGTRGSFVPYTTMADRGWGTGTVDRLYVRATAWEDVPRLNVQIPKIIAKYQDTTELVVRVQDEQLERIRGTFLFVEALLWLGIAASLLLGGFGIWYGTFAAVRARTREVGLKKAMGGSDADILAQFLAEALCKAVAGGVVGIVLGTVVVEVGSALLKCGLSYTQLAISSAASMLFSALIGVVGGLLPAIKASRMDVVSALRFE